MLLDKSLTCIAPYTAGLTKALIKLQIVRVHYFVRGGLLVTARVQVQSISPPSSGRVARFLGGQTGVALHRKLHVGVNLQKKPTPDVAVFET
ncbi:hypothetical protein TNCV_4545231 [Trichonephila clavipes]|nr:hypothetical protein TNCV_4545231 [Trichonephila clavipes]